MVLVLPIEPFRLEVTASIPTANTPYEYPRMGDLVVRDTESEQIWYKWDGIAWETKGTFTTSATSAPTPLSGAAAQPVSTEGVLGQLYYTIGDSTRKAFIKTSSGWVELYQVPQGATGEAGTHGADGVGEQGIQGIQGIQGESIKGDKGDSIKGDKGDKGDSIKGDRGEAGSGASVTGVSTGFDNASHTLTTTVTSEGGGEESDTTIINPQPLPTYKLNVAGEQLQLKRNDISISNVDFPTSTAQKIDIPVEYIYKALSETAVISHEDFEVGGMLVPSTKLIFLESDHNATVNDLQDKILIGWCVDAQTFEEARLAGQYAQIIGHTATSGNTTQILAENEYTLTRTRTSDNVLFVQRPVPNKLLWLSYNINRNELVLTFDRAFLLQEFSVIPAIIENNLDMSGDATYTAIPNLITLKLNGQSAKFVHYIGRYKKTTNFPDPIDLALYVKSSLFRYDPDTLWLKGQHADITATRVFRITPELSHTGISPTNENAHAIVNKAQLDTKVIKTETQEFSLYGRMLGSWTITEVRDIEDARSVNIIIQSITDRLSLAVSVPVDLSGHIGNSITSSGTSVPSGYLILQSIHNQPLNDETDSIYLAWGEEAVIAEYEVDGVLVVKDARLTPDAYAAVGFQQHQRLNFYSKQIIETPMKFVISETETNIIWTAEAIDDPSITHLIGSIDRKAASTSFYKPLNFNTLDSVSAVYLEKLDDNNPESFYRFTRFNSSTAQRYLFTTAESYEPSKIHRIGVDLVFYIANTSGVTSVVRTLDEKTSLSRYDECKVLYDQGTHTMTFPNFEDTFAIIFASSNSAYFTHELFNVGDYYGGDSGNVFVMRGKWIYDMNDGVERIRGMFLTGTTNYISTLASSAHLEMRFAAYSKEIGGLD